jgi:hypothetical protein
MTRALAFVVACAVCSSAGAAEPTADDYVSFFKPLAGEWAMKVTIGDKHSDAQFDAKLLPDKKCFVSTFSGVRPYPAFTSIDGYDPAAKKWKVTAFDTAGDHWVTYLSANAETLKGGKPATLDCSGEQIQPDGTVIRWKSKWTYSFDDNKFVIKITQQTRNGEKTPDEEYVSTRKKRP